jgi:hypothetical protein
MRSRAAASGEACVSAGRDRAAERPSPLARECVQWPMRVLTRPVRTPGLTVIMNSGDSASRTQCQFATHTKGGTAAASVGPFGDVLA